MRIMLRRMRRRRRSPVFHSGARRHRPLTQRQRLFFKILIALSVLMAVLMVSLSRIMPVIAVLARAEAREYVMRAINGAIKSEVESGSLDYNRLVTFEKDDTGNITALVTNSALINLIQARITNGIVDGSVNLINTKMSIPIGNAIGGVVFIGRGPGVPVKLQSITNVQTVFANDFSSEGINQTRHKIILNISAEITIVLPGGRETTTVSTDVAVAETVIVGTVPNVYTDIGGITK